MLNIPGYQIKELIHTGYMTIILRGNRNSDNIPVVIKFLNKDYPSLEELSCFRREYEITNNLHGDAIINTYSLEDFNNSLMIIMEDFGGESIAETLHDIRLNISEALSVAIRMTGALMQTHQQNIIHKDINPSNFVWNPKTDQLKIIDFSISTELAKENTQFLNRDLLEGTLYYISPEQTGRMSRAIDYRTDLYSLGITFYELFTGELPFKGDDEIEIVHSHIAKTPVPPIEKNPEIPGAVSAIIMKLLSKTAEERYQTTLGLKKDLVCCLEEFNQKGKVENIEIGRYDVSERFEIPQRLYGREKEVAELIDVFEDTVKGRTGLLLIAGYSGIGKSSLIYKMQKPVVSKKGCFLLGKFDQLEQNTPYHGLIQAFSGLIRQLLTESQEHLEKWKKKLLKSLNPNAGIIVDLIPELEQVIGPQPPVPQLNPSETQNRFKMAFREFIRVFAGKDHPLVIVLDDLHWSDLSTLDLLKYLLTTGEVPHILFIGSYRDNEVTAGHPLLHTLDEIQRKNSAPVFRKLTLKPLKKTIINKLIADTFHCHPDTIKSLGTLIFKKTKGNPFFMNQLLYSLYRQGTFKFLVGEGRWGWNLKEIEKVEMGNNVIEFLAQRLQILPSGTLQILKLASCIGNNFTLNVLVSISEQPFHFIADALWTAIEEDIISPLNNNYKLIRIRKEDSALQDIDVGFCFNHDRIHQVTYSLIPDTVKSEVHLKIGRLFREFYSENESMEHFFDLVNHLNSGRELILQKKERIELADINIIAGKKAKDSAAFTAAADYFRVGISLLSPEEWSLEPDKFFELSLTQAESTFLSGDIEKAGGLCEHLFDIAATNLEIGAVYNLKAMILDVKGEKCEAILDILRKGLKLFDIDLAEDHQEIDCKVTEGISNMQGHLAKTPIEDLVNLPEMKNKEKIMIMTLLFQAVPSAIQSYFPLFLLIQLTMFDQTLTHGTTAVSSKNFVDCGIIQGSILGDYDGAYKLGEAAFALINKYNAQSLKPSVYFVFCTFISQWRIHYRESLDYYVLVRKISMEAGDLLYASFASAHRIIRLLYTGSNLEECRQQAEKAIVFLSELQAVVPLFLAKIVLHFIQELQAPPGNNEQSDCEKKDKDLLEKIEESNNLFNLCIYGQLKILVNYLFGDMESVEKWIFFTEPFVPGGTGHYFMPDHYFIQSLSLTNQWKKATGEDQNKIMETLMVNREKLKLWADNCPENFSHKYYMLSAEMAIIHEESIETIIEYYKKAVTSIGKNDLIHMRALANELQGNFWIERGYEVIGKGFIREAYYLYEQWGSLTKLAILKKKFPGFFMTYEKISPKLSKSRLTQTASLDIASIIKSYQAISGEIEIEKLLKILMRTIIENAGAQKGSLLLIHESDNKLYIEALKSTDSKEIKVMHSLPIGENRDLCSEIIQYVARTNENIVLDNACAHGDFQNTPYIMARQVKSVLCTPIIYQNSIKGVVYLENNLSENVFTPERIEFIKILASQASISIENARLYETLGDKVKERTAQLHEANEKLKQQSLIDPLTNLHNRRYLYEVASDLIVKFMNKKVRFASNEEKRDMSIEQKVFGVFLIDLDHFKKVNDSYGHKAGDAVLVTVSRVLKKMIRSNDCIIRWGGEEFLIILNDTTAEYLKQFSKRALAAVQRTSIEISDIKTINITCSIGYVTIPFFLKNPKFLSLSQTINLSDFALYTAKGSGRNRVVHIKLKNQDSVDEKIKQYLLDLSKDVEVNEDYIQIDIFT